MAATQGEDEFNGDIIVDAFNLKPIIVPAECTGDISITASIQDLSTPDQQYNQQGNQVSSYISFNSIIIPASGTLEIEIDKDTTSSTTIEGAEISDCNLTNLEFIPAFYTSGRIDVS